MEFFSIALFLAALTLTVQPTYVTSQTSNEVTVTFQSDGVPSVASYLQYKKEVPPMKDFSMCFRIKLKQGREYDTVLSYAMPLFDNEIFVAFYNKELRVYCCDDASLIVMTKVDLQFMKWMSVCFSMELDKKQFAAVIDGKFSAQRINSTYDLRIRGGGAMYVAQEQDIPNGGFSPSQTIRGKVAELCLFDSLLSLDEMMSYTTCGNEHFKKEPLISFQNLTNDFVLSRVEVDYGYEIDNPCSQSITTTIILTERRNRFAGAMMCHALGSNMTVPMNRSENERLYGKASKYHDLCFTANTDYLWIGAMGVKSDQTFRHYLTNDILNNIFTIWNDKIDEKLCTAMFSSPHDSPVWFGGWVLADCLLRKCIPCTFRGVKLLKMRGLCQQSEFDRAYYVQEENQTILFYGDEKSVLVRLPGDINIPNDYGYWEIRSYERPRAKARMSARSPVDYPTGKHTWVIENDNCGVTSVDLVISVCSKGEFSCSDGSCIPLVMRCDLETNCPDGSDEDDCEPLIIPPRYSKTISPPRESPSTPLNVSVFVNVYSMRSFELSNFKFVTDTVVSMSWTDKRLRFRNLKNTLSLNNIGKGDVKPWTPNFEFLGGGNTSSDHEDRKYTLMVRRDSDPLSDDDQNVGEDEVFLGHGNPIVLATKATIETSCQFDLAYFPFDVQECSMVILMSDTTSNYAALIPDKDGVVYSGERKLREYFVSAVEMSDYQEGLYSGKRVKFVFENLVTFYVTNSYIPTLIMLVIGCCTFFFPLSDFQDRIMAAITALLVEASFFTQVSESIPKTAYLKIVDIWFVFCITILFLVTLALTVVNYIYYIEESALFIRVTPVAPVAWKNEKHSQPLGPPQPSFSSDSTIWAIKINRLLAFAFPAVIVFFVIIYSAISMASLNSRANVSGKD